MEGLQSYMEMRVMMVKQQVNMAETTITVVNQSLNTLRDRVTRLQQS
jgi:hypothetical protein